MTPANSPLLCASPRPAPSAARPLVSVVVPVRNEAKHIGHTLAQLVNQDYDRGRFEILVVDGESTDGTAAIVAAFAQRHPNIRLLANPRRWSSSARNIGVRHSQGDLVVVVDGHCELEGEKFLTNLVEAFERSGADCVGRPQPLDLADATPLQQAIAAARSSPLGHHPDSFIYSSCEGDVPASSVATAYRRRVFDVVGLFDEKFDACEDVELNHRIDQAGLRCYFTPHVAVRYQPRGSLGGLFRQMVRYGRGRIRLARKHPGTLSLRTLIPLAFVLGVVAGCPLSLVTPWLALPYAVALSVYAATVLLAALFLGGRRRSAMLPWLPLVFATIHFGSGTGMLLELCKAGGRQPQQGH